MTFSEVKKTVFIMCVAFSATVACVQKAMAQTTPVTTTGGTANYLPKFSGSSSVVNSLIYDNGSNVGIGIIPNGNAKLDLNGSMILRGIMTVARTGNASAAKAYPSNGFDFYSQAYSSSSNATVNPFFQIESEPTGNNTASPGATLNFLYSPNGTAAETGLYINPNGTIHFTSAQTFPITTGPQGPQGPAGPQGPTGPQGPAGPAGLNTLQLFTSTTLLQPFTSNTPQYGSVIGVSNGLSANDFYAQYKSSLIFRKACTASNFQVNLGYESLQSPFVMTVSVDVNGTPTPLSCDTGFATGYGFSCSSSGTYAIAAGSQVSLDFSHTGTNPANVYPQVTWQCQ